MRARLGQGDVKGECQSSLMLAREFIRVSPQLPSLMVLTTDLLLYRGPCDEPPVLCLQLQAHLSCFGCLALHHLGFVHTELRTYIRMHTHKRKLKCVCGPQRTNCPCIAYTRLQGGILPYPPPLDGHQRRGGDAVLLLVTKTLLTTICTHTHHHHNVQ